MVEACLKLPSWDRFEYVAYCWSGSSRMAQTIEGNVPELSAVPSKCNHIHAEDDREVRALPTCCRSEPTLLNQDDSAWNIREHHMVALIPKSNKNARHVDQTSSSYRGITCYLRVVQSMWRTIVSTGTTKV